MASGETHRQGLRNLKMARPPCLTINITNHIGSYAPLISIRPFPCNQRSTLGDHNGAQIAANNAVSPDPTVVDGLSIWGTWHRLGPSQRRKMVGEDNGPHRLKVDH